MKTLKEGVMWRLALLACLFLPIAALAQESASTPATNLPSQLPAGVSQDSMKAPAPGHPLDPHDVAVLTGKDKEHQSGAYAADGAYFADGANSAYGYGFGRGRRSDVPLLAGDIFAQSPDLSIGRLPVVGFGSRPFFTPFFPRRLGGSFFRFPLFGKHRPGFGFRL